MTAGNNTQRSGTGSSFTDSPTIPASQLEYRIEEYDDRSECTLFPANISEDDIVTTWVTATGDDAFVDLETIR